MFMVALILKALGGLIDNTQFRTGKHHLQGEQWSVIKLNKTTFTTSFDGGRLLK